MKGMINISISSQSLKKLFLVSLSYIIIVSSSLSIHLENDVAYAANGTITFSGPTADGFGPDHIATDGEGGSSDIPGITIQVFGIDDTGTILNDGTMNYFDGNDPNWLGYPPLVTWFDDKNTPTYGLAIKSEDESNFKLSSVNFHDWGYWDGRDYVIEAFDDGISKGTVMFKGNTDGNYIALNHSSILTSTFDNIDEVRIYGKDGLPNHYISINDIEIADVVLPDTTPPNFTSGGIQDITTTSATIYAKINENATLYYIIAASSVFPSIPQIIAGLDGEGNQAIQSGNALTTAEVSTYFNVVGLELDTPYFIFFVAEDNSNNMSTVAFLQFITDPNIYEVTFIDWDGKVLKTEPVISGYNASAPVDPTREGYMFTGWDRGFTNVMRNLTVTAQYKAEEYTVSFDSNGGSAIDEIKEGYGNMITAPTPPTRTGYTFEGWYKDAALTTAWDFTADKVQADMTFYAKWTANAITSVEALADIRVQFGTNLADANLPATIAVTLIDNTTENLAVSWDGGTPAYNGRKAGTYKFKGQLETQIENPNGVTAEVNVIVRPRPTPPPLNIQATITADPALTEEQLDGSTITVNVSDTDFMMSLTPEYFELLNAPNSMTIREVQRISSSQAKLTLAFDGTRLEQDYDLGLMIHSAALTSGSNIVTNNSLAIQRSEIPYRIIIKEGTFEPTKIWSVKLSNVVDSSTLQDALYMVDTEGNRFPAIFTSEGSQIFIHPPVENYADGTYTLYITPTLKDAKGRSLKEPIQMIFTIESVGVKLTK